MDADWYGIPLRPLAGGYSGETFLVGDGDEEMVVRIYARSPQRCLVDASLLRLVAGILPVPTVLDERPPAGDRPGVLVTSRLPGTRLDLLLPQATARQRTTLGESLGRVLATLSGIPMLRFGMFVDADLRISADGVPGDLAEWAQRFRDAGRLGAWSTADFQRLRGLCADAEDELAAVGGSDPAAASQRARVVLAHSDFNAKNVLVDPGSYAVTGVLDWEFAHAGSAYTDIGNLTRFARQPDLLQAVTGSFVDHAPPLAKDPLRLGRCVDLWALIELAGGGPPNGVRRLAEQLLRAQARSHDVMAWPFDESRQAPSSP